MKASSPDGGYGWVVCGLAFVLGLLLSTYFALYGVIFLDMSQRFQVPEADVAWVGAICTLLAGVGGLFYSPLIQKFGARATGMHAPLLVAAGYVSSAFASNIYVLYLTLGLMPGLGVSCYGAACLILIQEWFSRRRALAMGIHFLGGSVGAFMWPPFTTFLMEHYSWHGALMLVGGIHLHGLPCMALLRSVPHNRTEPQQVEMKEANKIPADQLPVAEDVPASKTPNKSGLRCLLRDPTFYVFFLAIFLMSFSHIIPFSYMATKGMLSGFSDTSSAFLAAILGASNGIFTPLSGFLGTWANTKRIFIAAANLGLAGLSSVFSIFCSTYAMMVAYVIIFGALSAAYLSNILASMADLWDRQYISYLTACDMVLCGLSFFVAHITTGALLEATGNMSLIFIIVSGLQITCGLLFTIAGLMKREKTFLKM